MKIVLISLVSFFASLAVAQLPDATALKAKANTAIDNGAQETQNAKADVTKAVEAEKTKAKAIKQNALVNLNTASADDLAKLPGVGPTHAKAIIDARPYNDVSDLKKVKGIKEEAVAKLKGLVTVK